MAGAEKVTVTVIQESAEDLDINTPEGYRLVWHDEFNEGTSLGNDWTHEVQGAGWVNNELQNYVNGSADGKRVTELVDGKLNINCFKGSDGKIYSGRVYALSLIHISTSLGVDRGIYPQARTYTVGVNVSF